MVFLWLTTFTTFDPFSKRHNGANDVASGETSEREGWSPTNNAYSRFELLKNIVQPCLCQYLDLQTEGRDRVFLVAEHHNKNLATAPPSSRTEFLHACISILSGLKYLHSEQIVHRSLCLENVLVTESGHVKLAGFGLYYLTGQGRDVPFVVGNPLNFPPEILEKGPRDECSSTTKGDIWTFGMLLLTLLRRGRPWVRISAMCGQEDQLPNASAGKMMIQLQEVCWALSEMRAEDDEVPQELYEDPYDFDDDNDDNEDEEEEEDVTASNPTDSSSSSQSITRCRFCRACVVPCPTTAELAKIHTAFQRIETRVRNASRSSRGLGTAVMRKRRKAVYKLLRKSVTAAQQSLGPNDSSEAVCCQPVCYRCWLDLKNFSSQDMAFCSTKKTDEDHDDCAAQNTKESAKTEEWNQQLLSLLKCCLRRNLVQRPTAASLLSHPLFQSKGLPAPKCVYRTVGRSLVGAKDTIDAAIQAALAADFGDAVPGMSVANSAATTTAPSPLMKQQLLRRTKGAFAYSQTGLPISLQKLYYLWRCCGGDLKGELVKAGKLQVVAAAEKVPLAVLNGGGGFLCSSNATSGKAQVKVILASEQDKKEQSRLCVSATGTAIQLSEILTILKEERNRMRELASAKQEEEAQVALSSYIQEQLNVPQHHHLSPEQPSNQQKADAISLALLAANRPASTAPALPKLPSELALRYCVQRLLQFDQLLKHAPSSRHLLMQLSRVLPPLVCQSAASSGPAEIACVALPDVLRPQLWCTVLQTQAGLSLLRSVDKAKSVLLSTTCGDQWQELQLNKDIPRCHQYHPLLAVERGRAIMKEVIKQWLVNNPTLDYWQGLDSVCAAVVVVYSEQPDTALAVLQAITNKYLSHLFCEGRIVVESTLHFFSQLLSFYHPQLSCRLHSLRFPPQLYAVSWFLTLFSHILPLDQLCVVWDAMLVRDKEFVHFVALSVVLGFADHLLQLDFNRAIVFFTNLAPLDINATVARACQLYDGCPSGLRTLTDISGGGGRSNGQQGDSETSAEVKTTDNVPSSAASATSEVGHFRSDSTANDSGQSKRNSIKYDVADAVAVAEVGAQTLFDLCCLDKQRVMVLDLQSFNSYSSCHWPRAVHISYSHDDSNVDAVLAAIEERKTLLQPREAGKEATNLHPAQFSTFLGAVGAGMWDNSTGASNTMNRFYPDLYVAVVAPAFELAHKFAVRLVEAGIPFVSVVRGGISELQASGFPLAQTKKPKPEQRVANTSQEKGVGR